jgi:hypothetical protein
MGDTVLEAARSGLALGGVLAVAAAWSRAAQRGALPHLGVGAVAGVAIMFANRASALPALVVIALVGVAGLVLGDLAARLDAWVRDATRWPGRPTPPLLADAAVLGAFLALTFALRPPLAVPFPFGPLGGRASLAPAVLALALGVAAAALVAWGRLPATTGTWRAAAAATAMAAALAGGAVGSAAVGLGALPTMADSAGLAFRAAAAALLGRAGPLHAGLAGLALGFGEGLLWLVSPRLSILPAVLAATVGFALIRVPASRLNRGHATP